jgi:hypothetical protein
MARYNSVNSTSSVAGGTTISTPSSGLLTTLTGSGTVTIPNPVYYTGQTQTFYNASGAILTLSTPGGNFTGPGTSGTASQTLANGAIITLVSDGTNYIAQAWLGGAVNATNITSTGAVTLNPANASISLQPTGTGIVTIASSTGNAGTIDNMNIGATTQGTGKFSSLSATGATTLTSTGAASAYNTAGASLLVSGGVGIGGAVYTNSTVNVGTSLNVTGSSFFTGNMYYGTTQSSIPGNLAVVGTARIHLTDYNVTTSALMNAGSTNDMLVFNAPFSASPASGTNAGAKWGIRFTGGPTGYYDNLGKSSAIYAVSEDGSAGYNRATGLAFYTNGPIDSTYTEKVRITGTGYVGIGTNSPNSLLTVSASTPTLQMQPSGYGATQYASYFATQANAQAMLQLGNNGTNWIVGGNSVTGGQLTFIVNNTNAAPATPNGTTALTLASGGIGNFPVGLQLGGSNVLSAGNYTSYVTTISGLGTGYTYPTLRNMATSGISHFASYPYGSGAPTTYDYALEVGNGSRGWEISADWVSTPVPYIRTLRDCCINWSSWYSFSVAAASDRRRKTNIEPLTDHRKLIFGLTATRYDVVNEDGTLGAVSDEDPDLRVARPKEIGYIAQDAIKIVPEVVKFNPRQDTPNDVGWANAYTVDYERLVPVVTEAIKENYTDIDALKDMVTAMQSQIAALQAEIVAIKGKSNEP